MILRLSGTQEAVSAGMKDADLAAQRVEENRRADERLALERKQEERLKAADDRQAKREELQRAADGMRSIGQRLETFKQAGPESGSAMVLSTDEQWAATQTFGRNITSVRPVSDAAGTGWMFYADGESTGIIYDAGTAEIRESRVIGNNGVTAYYAVMPGRHDLPDMIGGSVAAKPGDLLYYQLPDGTLSREVDPAVINPPKPEKPKEAKPPTKTVTEGAAAKFEAVLDDRLPWPKMPGKESTLPVGDTKSVGYAIRDLESLEDRTDEQEKELDQLRRHQVVLESRAKMRQRMTDQFKAAFEQTGDYDEAIAKMEESNDLNRETSAYWPPASIPSGEWPAMSNEQDAEVKKEWHRIVMAAGSEEAAVEQLTALLRDGKL